jgi:hypothetical protein
MSDGTLIMLIDFAIYVELTGVCDS